MLSIKITLYQKARTFNMLCKNPLSTIYMELAPPKENKLWFHEPHPHVADRLLQRLPKNHGIHTAFIWHNKDPYEEMEVSDKPLNIVQNTLRRAKLRHIKEAYILQERQKKFKLPQPDKLPCIAIDSPSKEFYIPYDEKSYNHALRHYELRIIKERQTLNKNTTSKIALSPYFVPQTYLDAIGVKENTKHIYTVPLTTYYVRTDSPDTEIYTKNHMDFITKVIDLTNDLLHNLAIDADMVEPEEIEYETGTQTITVEKTELEEEEPLIFLNLYKYFISLIHEQQNKEKPEKLPKDIKVPYLNVTPYKTLGKNLKDDDLIRQKIILTKKKTRLYEEDVDLLREFYGEHNPEVAQYMVETPGQWEGNETVSKVTRLKVMQKLAAAGIDILLNIKLANYPYTMKNAYTNCYLRLKKYEEKHEPNKIKKSQPRHNKKNTTTNNKNI